MSIGTVRQHVSALRNFSNLNVEIANVRTLNRIPFRANRFDVIVLHYSIVIARGFHIDAALRLSLGALKALKVLFIQDEYRWIDATAEAVRELGISVIFTVLNWDIVDKVYHHPWLKGVRKEITLTGFVDEQLLNRVFPRMHRGRLMLLIERAKCLIGSDLSRWRSGPSARGFGRTRSASDCPAIFRAMRAPDFMVSIGSNLLPARNPYWAPKAAPVSAILPELFAPAWMPQRIVILASLLKPSGTGCCRAMTGG